MQTNHLSSEVTVFLDNLKHPFRKEIEKLRTAILDTDSRLTENIKWNGPNYCFEGNDCITMRVQPPKQLQLIFHRGAKVKEQPTDKLIKDTSGLLTWKGNDRAIVTFKNMDDIEGNRAVLSKIIKDWIFAIS